MKIPKAENDISNLIDAYHELKQEPPRPHMGVSQLGHSCDRWLWLSFRWAVQPKFPGRVLRLFRRGQMEEISVINDLRAIGMDIRASENNQEKVNFNSHVSGSLDGIIKYGVPEAPKTAHVLEIKTHSIKSFNDLERNGVEKSKPEHYVQMQVYMHGTEIDRALYLAICKNDDKIYTERIRYDKETAIKYIERGKRIALSDRMPEPLSADPSWYECKWCPAHEFCFETNKTQHVNCRTCSHSTAQADSSWRCERHDSDNIPVDFQGTGCESHVLHPDLVPWARKASDDPWQAIYIINGVAVANGEPCANVYGSKEILANNCIDALVNDEFVRDVRVDLGGRIVG